jgi:hypothetical protein
VDTAATISVINKLEYFYNYWPVNKYQQCDSYGVLGNRPIRATESKGEKLSI